MNITIRIANHKDIDFVFKIRTDKVSNKFSIQKKNIKYSEHKVWFKEYLKSSQNRMYIALANNKKSEKIGYIRFDLSSFYNEVSICVDSKYHNQGLASNIIGIAEKKIKNSNLLIAKVLKSNLASKKLFEKHDYVCIFIEKKICIYAKILNAKKNYSKNYLKIIDEIELVRTKNNVNWMDILRIAFKESPQNASKVFKKISDYDARISKLSKKL